MSTAVAYQPEQEPDPLLAVVSKAPVIEASPEEAAAFEEGLVEIEAGRTVSAEHVRARLASRDRA